LAKERQIRMLWMPAVHRDNKKLARLTSHLSFSDNADYVN
jgi:hypothetical protein